MKMIIELDPSHDLDLFTELTDVIKRHNRKALPHPSPVLPHQSPNSPKPTHPVNDPLHPADIILTTTDDMSPDPIFYDRMCSQCLQTKPFASKMGKAICAECKHANAKAKKLNRHPSQSPLPTTS